MKKVANEELRAIDGGYKVKCTYCGKRSGSTGKVGVTAFYAKHYHWSGSYVIWDGANGDKCWS